MRTRSRLRVDGFSLDIAGPFALSLRSQGEVGWMRWLTIRQDARTSLHEQKGHRVS